jgi:hypothetical protein
MAWISLEINQDKFNEMLAKLKEVGLDQAKVVIGILKENLDDVVVFKGIGGAVLETVDGLIINKLLDELLAELEKV